MKKKTEVFDHLDNVLGNYQEGLVTEQDVIDIAWKVNEYLIKNPHPHDLVEDQQYEDPGYLCPRCGYMKVL